MSLIDSILDLASGTYVVTRHAVGSISDGVYVPSSSPTTFEVVASIQPARGLPRVTGGRDMISDEQNQHVVEALVMYTATQVSERTPSQDPDTVVYNGRTYTCARSEFWEVPDEEPYWTTVLTLQTLGAS